MSNKCERGLTSIKQIMSQFWDDNGKGCTNCPNLQYDNGMMTCGLIEGDGSNEN